MVFNGDNYDAHGLAIAVIQRAVDDALKTVYTKSNTSLNQESAKAFLLKDSEDLDFWLTAAGLDKDAMRTAFRASLAEVTKND